MIVKQLYEERKVITLWGERGWHSIDANGYSEDSVIRGFRSMNTDIARVVQEVTLHSVSYSHVVLPPAVKDAPGGLILVTATLLYSGYLDIVKVFRHDQSGKALKGDEMVIQVWL